MFPIYKFHNHSPCGFGCISSKWPSVTAFKVEWIYINIRILAYFGYSLFESFICNFVTSSEIYVYCIVRTLTVVFQDLEFYFEGCYGHFWPSLTLSSISRQHSKDDQFFQNRLKFVWINVEYRYQPLLCSSNFRHEQLKIIFSHNYMGVPM